MVVYSSDFISFAIYYDCDFYFLKVVGVDSSFKEGDGYFALGYFGVG